MPHVKDITGDLGKLRDKGALPRGEAPTLPQPVARGRTMALNSISIFFWATILAALALQVAFLIWLG
jgi:hypothetical protein